MASIRRRKRTDGSRAYQVRVEGIPARTFTRREDAELYALEMERSRRLGTLYLAPVEGFGSFLDAYLERRKQRVKPSTARRYDEVVNLLGPLHNIDIPRIRRSLAEDLLAEIAKRAPRQAQMATALLKATLRSAQERGQPVDEAVFAIKAPSYERREPMYLTVEQLYLLGSWMPEALGRIVPMAGLTGMRQGELLSLRDSELGLDDGRLRVLRGKTAGSRRTVALAGDVVTLLREQLLVRPTGTPLVFPAPRGGVYERNRFMERVFRPAAIVSGLGERDKEGHYSGLVFHDLRHTFVSLMIRAGVSVRVIAEQIGHADGGALLLRRYAHLYPDSASEATKSLQAMLDAVEREKAREA